MQGIVGECERVVYWCCIGSITATPNILHVCNVYVQLNLRFVQIYAVAVRVECPALSPCALLIFPAYAQLSLPHVESSLVLSCVIAGSSESIYVHYQ